MNALNKMSLLNTTDLAFKALELSEYYVVDVKVEQELSNYMKFATATVVQRNPQGYWNDSTIHYIELKHCYHRHSNGPQQTPYAKLVDKIIKINSIISPTPNGFNIVDWSLIEIDDFKFDGSFTMAEYHKAIEQQQKQMLSENNRIYEESTEEDELVNITNELICEDEEFLIESLELYTSEEDMILCDIEAEQHVTNAETEFLADLYEIQLKEADDNTLIED